MVNIYKSVICRLIVIVSTIALVSCQEDNKNFSTQTGTITPQVVVNPAIYSSTANSLSDIGCEAPSLDEVSLRLTDLSGQYSGEWPSVMEFNTESEYRVGSYLMEAFHDKDAEGFNRPALKGDATFQVVNGATTMVSIECTVANTIVKVIYSPSLQNALRECQLTFHSTSGGEFIKYPQEEDRALFLNPGDIGIIAELTMNDGRSVRINPAWIRQAQAARLYTINVDVDTSGSDPVLIIDITSSSSDTHRITLDNALLDGKAPVVTAHGFNPGASISAFEGVQPDHEIAMTVSGNDITNILLSTQSKSLTAKGFPAEIDLLNSPKELIDRARSMGLKWDGNTVSFEDLLPQIDYIDGNNRNIFTVVACDAATRVNEPMSLVVETIDPEIKVIDYGSTVVGENIASITISTRAGDLYKNLVIMAQDADNEWTRATVSSISSGPSNGQYTITFKVPPGNQDVPIQLIYCSKTKGTGVIKRVSPHFYIEGDAFANMAKVKVIANDKDLIPAIVHYLRLYDYNGNEYPIFDRNESEGIVEIVGLTADRDYYIRGSVLPSPRDDKDFSSSNVIHTEKALPLPNGDFEEIENSLIIKSVPSGGKYSQTIVEIFNQQNTTTYNVSTPKGWATVNAKTCCRQAQNKNTWYMQPSTQIVSDASSGAYAVKLTNVGWDNNGPEIPNYKQQGIPYLNYNPNIPHISYRAAGRLWLGSYSFNPSTAEEKIVEGVPFSSRPSTLNGIYKYLPGKVSTNERALARVKVWGLYEGKETLIATGEQRLNVSPDYKTFSVPIKYTHFGIKATKICVIIASSDAIGNISYETANIVTNPDPVTATSTGNSLWVDYLSFTY